MYNSNHYLSNQDLTELLEHYAKTYPDLCELEVLNKTDEGRDIYLLTIFDKSGPNHYERAAYWVDGCTHSRELAGTQACIHLAHLLLDNPNKDEHITDILKNYTVYILPRITPDGVEHIFETGGYVRSSNKQYPHHDFHHGFKQQSFETGRPPVFIRKEDPNGRWKLSKKDPRWFIPRGIAENDPKEKYYMLFPEGEFKNYDGFNLEKANNWELDFNRNYPSDWSNEGKTQGAGEYPLSQIETRTVVEAITARPNICIIQSFHTFSAVTLRPFANNDDVNMPAHDLKVYNELAKVNEAATGYETVSIHHGFKYHSSFEATGSFLEWAYSNSGIFTFSTEIWNIKDKVDLKKNHIPDLLGGYKEDEFIKIANFLDENKISERIFHPWKKIEHPQLGEVEVGGWDMLKFITNPPEEFLHEEVEKNAISIIDQMACLPKIRIKDCIKTQIEGDIYKLDVILENSGALPTFGSEQARKIKKVQLPTFKLTCKNVEILEGISEGHFEHIEGRTQHAVFSNYFFGLMDINSHQKKFTWIIKGSGKINLDFNLRKGGKISHIVEI